jgi:hypothetical protein
MKNFRKVFKIIFILAFILVLAQITLYIFLGYNLLSDPEGSGEHVGKFLEGVTKNIK